MVPSLSSPCSLCTPAFWGLPHDKQSQFTLVLSGWARNWAGRSECRNTHSAKLSAWHTVGFSECGLEPAGGLTVSCSAGGFGENCMCSPCFMRYMGRSFKKHKWDQAKPCLKPFSGFPLKSAQNPDLSLWPVRPSVVHGSCPLSLDFPAAFHPTLCAHHNRPPFAYSTCQVSSGPGLFKHTDPRTARGWLTLMLWARSDIILQGPPCLWSCFHSSSPCLVFLRTPIATCHYHVCWPTYLFPVHSAQQEVSSRRERTSSTLFTATSTGRSTRWALGKYLLND